ncbi:MAG: AAA family ATPase [Coraliomargaritaceae bacterium]
MSEKEPPNPLDEIQKQLSELFKGSNVKVSAPGMVDSSQSGTSEPTEDTSKENPALQAVRSFHLKPKEVRDYLDRFVVRQDEAKKVLSVAICDHYNQARQRLSGKSGIASEYSKPNILLLGPTGVGKTYLIRNIARLIGVPFVKADATKFSETGYVGSDVEDLVRDLVKVAEGNVELARYGIIFVDEIDKIASESSQGGRDVSGRGVQINLLKLMEETDVNLISPTDMMSQMQAAMEMQRGGQPRPKSINTRHILFIVSGAFDKLGESIRKRLTKSEMGFGANLRESDEDTAQYLQHAETRDFIQYGFEPEFIGRVPVRVACEPLKEEDLSRILTTSEGSILNQYRDDFTGYGIDFNISGEAILSIARLAAKERTGARGLMTVLERTFRDFKFELPSTAIKCFDIDAQTVENSAQALNQIKKENAHLQHEVWLEDIKRFATVFEKRHGFTLEFRPLAIEALISEAEKHDRTLQSLCEEKFKDFEHGLSIIHRNSGQTVFRIGKPAIEDPDGELSKWVVRSIENLKNNAKD